MNFASIKGGQLLHFICHSSADSLQVQYAPCVLLYGISPNAECI
jgi:hypothetical protein